MSANRRSGSTHNRRMIAAWMAGLMLLSAAGAASAQPRPRPLGEQRWSERSYGLSLRPPVGCTLQSQTADDYLVRIADAEGRFMMALAVKRSARVLTLKRVLELAREQILGAQGTSKFLDERTLTVAERPAGLIWAEMPQATGPAVLFGQAVVELDPQTYAVLESRCDPAEAQWVRPTFEAVLRSLEMSDPQELNRQRAEALQRGDDWRREELTLEQLHAALIDQQFFRIVREGDDIGYMRVRQSRGSRSGKPGVLIETNSRIAQAAHYFDSLAEFFLADDDTMETWSLRTTRRAQGTGSDAAGETFLETGVRAEGRITVTLEGPHGRDQRRFDLPPVGYLSQVEAWLLPQLLPIDAEQTFGFYCYNSRSSELNFRTERVIPILSGFTLVTRLSPNDAAIEADYDTQRRLIEKELGGGQKLLPATPEEIRRRWAGR